MSNNNKFVAPQQLVVPLNTSFSLYSINTNGLSPTTITGQDNNTPHAKHGNKVVLDKQRVLTDIFVKNKLDALCICETHQTRYLPPNTNVMESRRLEDNKHGTAVITTANPTAVVQKDNIAALKITWEDQDLWIISAYFPNNREETIHTIKELESFSRKHNGDRVILTGDFNSTRTLAKEDAGGPLPPMSHRQNKARLIQDYLSANSFSDLWNTHQNTKRDSELHQLKHLTHWNHDHTRGVRLDRIYANFKIVGLLSVKTLLHPGSDHKALMLTWSMAQPSIQAKVPDPLPHRAFELPQIKDMTTTMLKSFIDNPLPAVEIIAKWDVTKTKITDEACKMWHEHVKKRGIALRKAGKNLVRSLTTLAKTPHHNPLRPCLAETYRINWLEWNTLHAQDIVDRRDAISTKMTRTLGKTEKDFLAKPRNKSKVICNMTIDNLRDKPNLPRTDDKDVIIDNFVKYYKELYAHKPVEKRTLKKMIGNLTMDLSNEQMGLLDNPISEEETIETILKLPNNKSPGTDRLTYELYKCSPVLAADAIVMVANAVTDAKRQPPSWGNVLVSVIPKEDDSYSTHKFRPISLLNCDYKIMMRIWANRLGNILADKIGQHQRGFIPGRDGRENIVNVQLIIDLINARNNEGAMVFLDQEKAFDMVSFTTIKTIFKDLKWPERFRSLIHSTYKDKSTWAHVIVNGKRSESTFPICLGTRQGCPLSPLIFAIVADLFNTAVINNGKFKGHESIPGFFVKISAYADDTGVHLGSIRDIAIYKDLLQDYSKATGGITNMAKSEAVLLGKWRVNPPPDIGVRIVEASKYLGVITGTNTPLQDQAIIDREAKVYRQMEYGIPDSNPPQWTEL